MTVESIIFFALCLATGCLITFSTLCYKRVFTLSVLERYWRCRGDCQHFGDKYLYFIAKHSISIQKGLKIGGAVLVGRVCYRYLCRFVFQTIYNDSFPT